MKTVADSEDARFRGCAISIIESDDLLEGKKRAIGEYKTDRDRLWAGFFKQAARGDEDFTTTVRSNPRAEWAQTESQMPTFRDQCRLQLTQILPYGVFLFRQTWILSSSHNRNAWCIEFSLAEVGRYISCSRAKSLQPHHGAASGIQENTAAAMDYPAGQCPVAVQVQIWAWSQRIPAPRRLVSSRCAVGRFSVLLMLFVAPYHFPQWMTLTRARRSVNLLEKR